MSKVIALLGIVVVGGALVAWKLAGKSEQEAGTANGDTKGSDSTDMKATEKKLSTKTSYNNPAGSDEVAFHLSVNSEGVITDASVDILAVHAVSQTRQLAFSQGLPEAIKGKKLADLSSIDRVGGSSLTTGAFNASLADLKSQL